ncbi:MAG: hypothetical protein HZA51_02200 [Planctomycetes bacterium]|nr:hypothetical protein [Planctomycetota bacterium]
MSGGTPGTGLGNPGTVTQSVSASLLEQLSLERINRARLHPATEAANNSISVDEGIPGQINTSPKQPVALNASLMQSARRHSQDMLTRDYFAHNTPEGLSPFDRMEAAGYVIATAGQNLAWRGTTGTINELSTVESEHTDLFVDTGIAGRGHRVTMLNGDLREVGIGILRGQFTNSGTTYDSMMQTQDFGTSPNTGVFVMGVVYNDNNNNNQYDFGEGIANSNVQLDNTIKSTNAGGGYNFEIRAVGAFTLRFLSTNTSTSLNIGTGYNNIKADLVDGTQIVINLGLGQF